MDGKKKKKKPLNGWKDHNYHFIFVRKSYQTITLYFVKSNCSYSLKHIGYYIYLYLYIYIYIYILDASIEVSCQSGAK
jgi:hypothetical protein